MSVITYKCSNSLTVTWLASILFTSCLQSQGRTLVKHVVIGQPYNWIKLMNISNKTHSTVQFIIATSER